MEHENWPPNLLKLVKTTTLNAIIEPWIVRTTRFQKNLQLPLMSSGRVTLLGDAAHAMPPDRGIGGNNVLEDARLLASLLIAEKSNINFSKVIGEYENIMFMRARKAVVSSEVAAKIHHLKSFCAVFVRNFLLKTLGMMLALVPKLTK